MRDPELELDAELENLMSVLAESNLEAEAETFAYGASSQLQAVRSQQIVLAQIAQGMRDENRITDAAFFDRYPQRNGRPLAAGELALRREWVEIRDGLVRPLLRAQPPSPASSFPVSVAPSAPTTVQTGVLASNIPEVPYSPEAFKRLERSLSVFDAIHTAVEVFADLLELEPYVFAATGPIATFFEFWIQMGNAYLEAQADIVKQSSRSAFRLGVVAGADSVTWRDTKELFWQLSPRYEIDASAGDGAAKKQHAAYNTGLLTGWRQGKEVAKNLKKQKFFWQSIVSTLAESDLPKFDIKSVFSEFHRGEALGGMRYFQARRLLTDWYIKAAARFDQLYLRD